MFRFNLLATFCLWLGIDLYVDIVPCNLQVMPQLLKFPFFILIFLIKAMLCCNFISIVVVFIFDYIINWSTFALFVMHLVGIASF